MGGTCYHDAAPNCALRMPGWSLLDDSDENTVTSYFSCTALIATGSEEVVSLSTVSEPPHTVMYQ